MSRHYLLNSLPFPYRVVYLLLYRFSYMLESVLGVLFIFYRPFYLSQHQTHCFNYVFITSFSILYAMTDPCLSSSIFRIVLVILAVYPFIWILDCSASVQITLGSWWKLYWTFVIMLETSPPMKIVCLSPVQIYFISSYNILPFSQLISWASFIILHL